MNRWGRKIVLLGSLPGDKLPLTFRLPPVSLFPSDFDRWFAEEIQIHEPALRAWLRGRFPAISDVGDVVQESYARVLQAHAQTPINSAKTFLFTTARNLALDQLRRRKAVSIEPMEEIDRLLPEYLEPTAADEAERQQELELLTQALQSLPRRCRQVLTLRKIYGLPQKEIASQLGITEHTVEAQVGIGLRRCAEFFARLGLP